MSRRRGVLVPLLALVAATSLAGEEPGDEPAAGMKRIAPRLSMSEARTLPQREVLYQRAPAVAYGGGTYLLVWQEGYNGLGGASDILGLRLDEEGRPIEAAPITICTDGGVQASPAVAFCAGRFLVAWNDFRSGKDHDVYATLVDAGGKVATPNGFLLFGGAGGQANPAIASDGKETFLVVWQDRRGEGRFDLYGARLSAGKGEVLGEAARLLDAGEMPAVAWNGKNYLVVLGDAGRKKGRTGCVVSAEGVPGAKLTLWSGRRAMPPAATAAWGKAFAFFNTSPFPDPWGWGANGAIVGVSVTPEGRSPEFGSTKHGWYDLARNQADRVVRNVIDAARWKNQNAWPMGAPGGFKGSHEDTWPSGRVAAAYNGRSILVVWNRANFLDRLRIANRDLYLKRVLDDWNHVDEPKIRLVAGATEEVHPALAAGATGRAVLAYERQAPGGGVALEYRLLIEEADRRAPRVAWIARESDARMVLGFDEPVDRASASVAGNYLIKGVEVGAAAFRAENPALGREVVIETDPQERGKTYVLRVKGVKDLAGNAAAGDPVEYLCKPGTSQRSDFIERWLVLGKFPNNWDENWIDPKTVHPSPDDGVAARPGEEIKAALRKAVTDAEWAKYGLEENCDRYFLGDKAWKVSDTMSASLLRIAGHYGKTPAACMYANTYVFSDREREVLVRVDSNDGNRFWLNGDLLSSNPAKPSRGIHTHTDEAPANLKKGWNQLLVQVENRFGQWQMVAQIVTPDRRPIRDLTYQLENPYPKE